MSSDGFKPSHSHYRPWFPNHTDDSVSQGHVASAYPAAPDSIPEDDNVSMTYAADTEPADYADDEYDQSEEDDREEENHDGYDDGEPDEPEAYPGVSIVFHANHITYDGPYHQTPYSPPAAQPTSTYLPDESDVSDGGAGPAAPINYLDIANILTSDIDMEEAFETAGGFPPFNHHTGNFQHPPQEVVEGILFGAETAASHWDVPPPQVAAMTSDNAEEVQQQLDQLGPGDEFEDGSTVWFPIPPPPAFISPNVSNLNPGNYPLVEFLQHWSFAGARKPKGRERFPWPQRVVDLSQTHLTHVQYADLAGDQCDMQGIDWADLKVTRKDARERRLLTYRNYTNQQGSDKWDPALPEHNIPRSDSFFRFRRMDIRRNINLSHFQLRNVLAATSRTQVFYTGSGVVHRFNPVSGEGKTIMKLPDAPHTQVSTLAADHGVIVAGGFNGEYMLRPVDSDGEGDSSRSYDGVLTNHHSGITNHVQVHLSRGSSSPVAAFASNDQFFRVLDIETKTYLSREAFEDPINCTAISPDRRLRVMVGDTNKVLITAAESRFGGGGRPEILQQLDGHRDFGFACDWADDGWTVATGFQDRLINVWDARRWTDSRGAATPLETIRTQMAGVRSLRFSPVGSGKRVLVAAEEADFVNVIDAQTFRSKQTVDIFGEIGGATFTDDGQDLLVLCTDRVRGGVLQFERCGLGAEASWDPDRGGGRDGDHPGESLLLRESLRLRGRTFDWPRNRTNEWKVVRESETRRRRKGASLDALEPF